MTSSRANLPRLLFLIGFSFTGKSSVGRLVAQRLGWSYVDTDEEIVKRAGKPVQAIFSEEGEEHFRNLEREVLQVVSVRQDAVVSTGGGIVLDSANRELMLGQGLVVCLEAKPETIYDRLRLQELFNPQGAVRPLLAGPDPLGSIRQLKEFRQALYSMADWTVHTDALDEEEVAAEVVRAVDLLMTHPQEQRPAFPSRASRKGVQAPSPLEQGAAFVVDAPSASYPVFVGWGILDELGQRIKKAGVGDNAFVVTDSNVLSYYGGRVQESLEAAGLRVARYAIPAGEESKTLAWAERLYQWLVRERAERKDAIVALGGGVVGDLAGFVAATYGRGMPLVHVPTSLLAMVDASIGGKVAVNMPQGKNLVGAFYQPRMVYMDVETLVSLPERERTSGWAEVLKHALILDPELLLEMESSVSRLLSLDKELAPRIIAKSVALKGHVVAEDERETTGKRTILNYGHTIGHALEAATEYQRLLHGEAVAIGMMGAAMLGHQVNVTPLLLIDRQRALLKSYGLPVSYQGADLAAVEQAMSLDKKTSGSLIQWVLLQDIGKPILHRGVPNALVQRILRELISDA